MTEHLILAAANDYIRQGLAVLPLYRPNDGGCSCPQAVCESPGKHPRVKWAEYRERAPTKGEVRTWRTLFETGNIAIIGGQPSGGFVGLDFDNRLNLENFLDIDPDLRQATPIVETARGGHVWLRTAKPPDCFRIAELGLDVKGRGGLLVAPPSLHATGKIYRFLSDPPAILQVPDFTAWLKERLDLLGVAWEPSRQARENGDRPRLDAAAALSELTPGNRNETFSRVAGRLHRDGWGMAEITALLAPHAERVAFPQAELEAEVRGICERYARPDNKPNGEPTPMSYKAEALDDLLGEQDDGFQVVIGDGGEGAVLTADGKGFVAGPTGVGKTNLLLRLSRCLCEGSPFLGLPIPEPRRVLYLVLEGSRRGMRRRLHKVWKDAQTDARRRFALAHIILNLGNEDDLNRLDALLYSMRPEVLIIDPLRNAHSYDENNSADASRLTAILDGIIARHSCAIILAHHDRKRPPFVRRDVGTDRVRGSTALTGWLSFCLSIDPDAKTPDLLLAEWTKTRDAEIALPPLVLTFDRETLDFLPSDQAPGGKVADDAILNAVFQAGGTYRGPNLVAGLKEGSGASDRWIRERLRALVKDGSLIQYVAPSDSKCGALTYALPDRELVETEP